MKTRRLTDQEVARLREQCRAHDHDRDHALLVAGLHTGYRISELLSWDISDVRHEGEWRDRVTVPAGQMKEGRARTVPINGEVRKVVGQYLSGRGDDEACVFRSQRGGRLSREGAWRAIQRMCERANLPTERVGTHSMRKTFGWRIYRDHGIRAAQKALGHSNPATTQEYLGVEQREIDRMVRALADSDDVD